MNDTYLFNGDYEEKNAENVKELKERELKEFGNIFEGMSIKEKYKLISKLRLDNYLNKYK